MFKEETVLSFPISIVNNESRFTRVNPPLNFTDIYISVLFLKSYSVV